MFVIANLTKEQIKAVQEFEYTEGVKLLALKEVTLEPELLAPDKLAVLNKLEQELGVCLLAVR